jgi:hypothetical protein
MKVSLDTEDSSLFLYFSKYTEAEVVVELYIRVFYDLKVVI